jgi:hypothetical protein
MLANIYLDKLDRYMKEYTEKFDRGKERKPCKQSISLENKRCRIRKKLKVEKDQTRKAELIKQLKANHRESLRFPRGDEMDAEYKRLKYVRYADDFLIGITGSKQDAINIREDIKSFSMINWRWNCLTGKRSSLTREKRQYFSDMRSV